MLPKRNRLTTKEFKYVFEKGSKYNTPSLLCVYLKNQDRGAISCAVSKKQYPNAVDRNSLRRLVYNCVGEVPTNTYIIILIKKKIDKNDEGAVCAEISSFISTL